MKKNTDRVIRRATRLGLPNAEQLRWLELSFTTSSFAALKRHRTELSREAGQPVTLGRALDSLIKSHPLVTGEQP